MIVTYVSSFPPEVSTSGPDSRGGSESVHFALNDGSIVSLSCTRASDLLGSNEAFAERWRSLTQDGEGVDADDLQQSR